MDPVRELSKRFSSFMAVRLLICGGMDPVSELLWSNSLLIAVRLLICSGMDPTRLFNGSDTTLTTVLEVAVTPYQLLRSLSVSQPSLCVQEAPWVEW
jgi:hypothetical protein